MLILAACICTTVQAQQLQVHGTVKDEKGAGLPGVTVKVKGADKGVATDKNGVYNIQVSNGGSLVFSFLGYLTKTVPINSRTVIDVSLEVNNSNLNEVVVTGVLDKRTAMNASIAISSINSTQIEKQAPVSGADLLKNIPGVYVNSSLGEIRNTVYSRGVSVGSNDGATGYYYVSMQEDGLPVTNATWGNYGPDYFYRPDATLGKLEAVRGGTASILGNNAPGGIFNYISKTGSSTFQGEFRAKVGLEGNGKNPYYRGDLNLGGPLSADKTWTYDVGGFYRYSDGAKYPGYPLNKGGQVKANIFKKYKTGSLKIYAKYLDDHNGWFEFTPTVGFTNPKPAPGFSESSSVLIPSVSAQIPINNTGTDNYNTSNMIESKDRSIGANWVQHLDSSWTFNNNIRYSGKEATWNATGVVYPLALNNYITYAILGSLGRPGTYTFTNARTGAPLANVTSYTGYDYTVSNSNLPGQAVSANSLFFEPLFYTKNKSNELLDQFSFTKTLKNMSFTFGGFYGYTHADNLNGTVGFGLGTIQNRPDLVNVTLATPTGQTYQVTNSNGLTGLGGTGVADAQANQSQLAFYFGHNWQITDGLNLDYGLRFESMHVKGFSAPSVANPQNANPTFGGADGNPLTLYDNAGGTEGTHYAFDRTINTVSYSAGLNYRVSDQVAFYGRYSLGNKAPDLSTYFAANSAYTSANLFVVAQHVSQAEAGIKFSGSNFALFATPFYSTLSNVPNVQTFTAADNVTLYSPPTEYEKVRTYGIELESHLDFSRNFGIKAVATFQNSKALNYKVWVANANGAQDDQLVDYSGNRADNSPNIILNVTPTYNSGKFFSFITWSYMGSREANVADAFLLPAFSQFNLGAGYDFTKKFQLSLNINNVLDKYGVMSWSRPGTLLQALDREGYTKAMYQADSAAGVPYSTIAIPPRAYFLTLTYKF